METSVPGGHAGTNTDPINSRIIARESKRDYLARVESAQLLLARQLFSPEMKRLFLRVFDSFQLNMLAVSVFARTRLPSDQIEPIEKAILTDLDTYAAEVDRATAQAQVVMDQSGVTHPAGYKAMPLQLDVRVISRFGRRYFELMEKVDLLMPMLETLGIYELISQSEVDIQKALFRRRVRSLAMAARAYAAGLRKRMRESAVREDGASENATGSHHPAVTAQHVVPEGGAMSPGSNIQIVKIAGRKQAQALPSGATTVGSDSRTEPTTVGAIAATPL